MSGSNGTNLLTEGNILKKLLGFAVPLFFGNLFQQLYNTADSLIVGNFAGSEALAAVSSSGSLIFLMVGLFNGIAMGAGVVIARYFGARDTGGVRRAVHATVFFGVVAGLILTVAGVVMTPLLLRWMGTPEAVLPQSITYFRTYFAGIMGLVLYNIAVGILQAMGDAKHPLIYLIISSLTNVVLDLLFVAVLGYGVGAAALATILSQFLSAGLAFRRLMTTRGEHRVELRYLRCDWDMLKQILNIGLPSGLQNSIISLANVIVQSNINAFGASAMAGCGVYFKIEGFGFLPVTCFAMALSTFVSQNIGGGRPDRAKKGAIYGTLCSMAVAELVGLVLYSFAPYIISAFNRDPEVIAFGVSQVKTEGLFYFLLAFSHCMAGVLRGAGRARVSMLVTLVCWCLIRITYITITVSLIPDIRVVFWGYPITWTLSGLSFLFYMRRGTWLEK